MKEKELDYSKLVIELEDILLKENSMVLATSKEDKVTARLINHINYGLDVLFSTKINSLKINQITANPQVALAISNLKIEGRAELLGNPCDHKTFPQDYANKFPYLGKIYKSAPDDILVIVKPSKLSLYKFINGACEDVLIPYEKKAYRMYY